MNSQTMQRLQAGMRRAYTQACTSFPRMNVTPINLALYQVYQDVAYLEGSTYVLMDPDIGQEILHFTAQAQHDLLAKDHSDRLLAGHPTIEAKRYAPLIRGLDPNAGRILIQLMRSGATPTMVNMKRTQMLQDRRNQLANALTAKAANAAYRRFRNAIRGEEVAQSSQRSSV